MVRDQSLRIVNRKEVEVASILVSDKEDFFSATGSSARAFEGGLRPGGRAVERQTEGLLSPIGRLTDRKEKD